MLHAAIEPITPSVVWSLEEGQCETTKTYAAHASLFYDGDVATSMHEIIEGVARIYKIFADGRRQIIAFAFPGDLVDYAENGIYKFDCDALTSLRVRAIPRNALLKAIRQRPEFGEKMLSLAATQIVSMQNLSLLLCRKSALEKLSTFLLSLAERQGERDEGVYDLPMTRAEIADHLGLTLETVSRNFTKLRIRRIISFPDTTSFRINDKTMLEDLAESEDGTQ